MAEDEEIKTHSFFKRIDWAKLEAREVQPPIIPKLVGIFKIGIFLLDFRCYFLLWKFIESWTECTAEHSRSSGSIQLETDNNLGRN